MIGVTFLFYHTLLNPRGELAAALQEGNVRLFLGVAAAFVVGTCGLWVYYWWQERHSARLYKETPPPVLTTPETDIPPTATIQTGPMPTTPETEVPPAATLQTGPSPAASETEVLPD